MAPGPCIQLRHVHCTPTVDHLQPSMPSEAMIGSVQFWYDVWLLLAVRLPCTEAYFAARLPAGGIEGQGPYVPVAQLPGIDPLGVGGPPMAPRGGRGPRPPGNHEARPWAVGHCGSAHCCALFTRLLEADSLVGIPDALRAHGKAASDRCILFCAGPGGRGGPVRPGRGYGGGFGRGAGYRDLDEPANQRPLLDYGDL